MAHGLVQGHTGCRKQEVCKIRWEWEIKVPEIGTSVFLIPAGFGGRHEKAGVKNGDERLVVLNSVAISVIDGQRDLHPVWCSLTGYQTDKDLPQYIE